jgi:hypothetical protein
MFHVLDHTDVVYSGDYLSQSTQNVIENYNIGFDEAIRSGIKILYTDMLHSLSHAKDVVLGRSSSDLWCHIEDWQVD